MNNETSTKSSIDTEERLILHLDGIWDALDFQRLFDSLTRLYYYYDSQIGLERSYEFTRLEYKQYKQQAEHPALPKQLAHLREQFIITADHIINNQSPLDIRYYTFFKRSFYPTTPLIVRSIQYASPGSLDLMGLGKVFEVIKEAVFYYFPNKDKQIETSLKEKELELKEQEVVAKKIENLQKLGFSQSQIQVLIGNETYHIEVIKNLADTGQITNVEVIK